MIDSGRRDRLQRNWPWLATVLVVVVTAGILVGSALGDDALSSSAGDVVYTSFTMPKGHTSSVRLPFGTVSVELTKALTTVSDDENMAGREAPDDGSFIGIETTLTKGVAPLSVGSSSNRMAHVGLVVGNRRYPIAADPLTASGYNPTYGVAVRAWVAVAGVPDDVAVSVEYDGVTQSVDPSKGTRHAGRASALYHSPAPAITYPPFPNQKRCGSTPRVTAGFAPGEADDLPDCRIGYLQRVPYVAGLGWAPTGRSWLAVVIDVDNRLFLEWHHNDGAVYRRAEGASTGTLTLNGARSVGSSPQISLIGQSSLDVPGLVGFFPVSDRLPAGTSLDVSVMFAHLVEESSTPVPGAPVAPTVRVTWKVAVP